MNSQYEADLGVGLRTWGSAPHNLDVLRDSERFCDGCGQKLPAGSKLGQQVVSKEEAASRGVSGTPNPDGTVTIDLCLDCRVKRANQMKHGY